MSDSENEFQDPAPQPSNAADVFRRHISQAVRAAHNWQSNVRATQYGDELVARLPSLSGSIQLPTIPMTSRPRRRRLTRSTTDRRRNSHARVRFTALDSPHVTRTSTISRRDLFSKGLYRREDTDVQMPLESTYERLCEKGMELFPALAGVECDILLGRGKNTLEELGENTTLGEIKATIPKGGFARLWLRPREPVLDNARESTTSNAPQHLMSASIDIETSSQASSSGSSQVNDTLAHSQDNSTQDPESESIEIETSSQASSSASSQVNDTLAQPQDNSTQDPESESIDIETSSQAPISGSPLILSVPQESSSSENMEHEQSTESLNLHLDMSADAALKQGVHQLREDTTGELQHVIVKRETIVNDMIDIYQNFNVRNKIVASFDSESGVDQGGITKEMFSLFWERAFVMYFKGQNAKVPHIQVKDRMKARRIYPVLGKILEHQLRILGSLPSELSQSCLYAMAHPDEDVDPDILIQDFIRFLPEPDAILLERCLDAPTWSANDGRRLLRLYGINRLTVLPSPGNLRECLLNMAQTEILDSCSRLLSMMRNGMSLEMQNLFMAVITSEQLAHFYKEHSSTTEAVAQLIDDFYERSDLQILEQIVVTHLSNCIREMTHRQLARFLRWLTGSTSMPTTLEVMFNTTVGIGRAPVAHTCGNLVELSTQYETYEDFRSEFMSVIESDEAFVFSMV